MQPVQQDITVYQGDRFDFFFRIRERTWNGVAWVPGNYINLTGKRARAEIRTTAGAPGVAAASFHYALANQEDPDGLGGVLLWLLPTDTTPLTENSVWDCQLETDIADPTDTQTYIMGVVTVIKQVTV